MYNNKKFRNKSDQQQSMKQTKIKLWATTILKLNKIKI